MTTDKEAHAGLSNRKRYKPIKGSADSSRPPSRALARASAPLGGSNLVFPRVLSRALDAVRQGQAPAVPNLHARWFFGQSAIVWIDPRDLTWRLHDGVHDGQRIFRLSSWFLDGADWTDVITPVKRLAEHRETLELVEFGQDYPEMPTFQRMMQRLKANRPAARYGRRLDSEERIHAYFRYFLQLIDGIRENGFREQKKMARLPSGFGVRGRDALHRRNIGVAVDANGRLLRFLGGRHRTAIAQALAIEAVPVEIRFVHADWLASATARTALDPARALQEWAKRVSLQDTATP